MSIETGLRDHHKMIIDNFDKEMSYEDLQEIFVRVTINPSGLKHYWER